MKEFTDLNIELKNIFVTPKIKTALLYNIANDIRGKRIRKFLDANDIKIMDVKSRNYLDPIGFLLGRPGFSPFDGKRRNVAISEEMLVMDAFEKADIDALLSFFKTAGIRKIALKAVVTRHNIHWNSYALYENLKMEHERLGR